MDTIQSGASLPEHRSLKGTVNPIRLQPVMLALAMIVGVMLALISVYVSFQVAVLLLILVVMGWAAVHQPEIGLIAVILVIPLETFNQSFSIGPFSAVKLLGAGAIVAFVLHYLVVDREKRLVNVPQTVFILLLLLVVIISDLVAIDPAYAVDKTLKLLRVIAFYFLVINVVRDRKSLNYVMWAFVISGFYSTLYGLYIYQTSPGSLDELRLKGTYDDAMTYSYAMAAMLPMVWYLLSHSKHLGLRIFLVVDGLLLMYGILLSGTRSGILAMLGIVVLLALRRQHLMLNLLILLVIGFAAVYLLPDQIQTRIGLIQGTDKGAQQSTERRMSYYTFGSQLFLENPFLGSGLGGFATQYGQSIYRFWLNPDDPRRVAHNMYLEFAIGVGLLGLIPLGLLVLSCFIGLQRLVDVRKHGDYADLALILQVSLAAYLFIGMFSSSQYDKPLWLLIGLAAVLPVLARQEERQALAWTPVEWMPAVSPGSETEAL